MNLRKLTSDIIANGGCSYSLRYGNLTSGYAVSPYKERETLVSRSQFGPVDLQNFCHENSDLLADPKNFIGGWIVENGDIMLDVSTVFTSKAKAIKVAKANNQKAIFHLDTMQTIEI